MLGKSLLLITYITFITSISPCWSADKGWERAVELAREIYNGRIQINVDELMIRLHAIKDAINDIGQNVPLKLGPQDRELTISALSLYKITEVNAEKCFQPYLNVDNNNFHRSNYIELRQILSNMYQTENIINFINGYHETQVFVCHNGLLAHFAIKWNKIKEARSDVEQLKSTWVASFPSDISINQISTHDKINGLVQFIKTHFPDDQLVRAASSLGHFKKLYDIHMQGNCHQVFLDPFRTLMMTYDLIRRDMPILEEYFGDIIRGYDLCTALEDSIKESELIAIRLALHIAGTASPSGRQRPAIGSTDSTVPTPPARSTSSIGPIRNQPLAFPRSNLPYMRPLNTPMAPESSRPAITDQTSSSRQHRYREENLIFRSFPQLSSSNTERMSIGSTSENIFSKSLDIHSSSANPPETTVRPENRPQPSQTNRPTVLPFDLNEKPEDDDTDLI